ncbi:MAG: cbb3-type cytochrome c oxidase subunit I [Proteobacteria bacterium]|nr:cbb3-type cytochrome c oxidase subunit I [Pseudomonadota bacterium]
MSISGSGQETNYQFTVSEGQTQRLARGWLTLGIFALAASGLFSILIVLSRTPALHEIIPWKDFFHTALVVHVDLSVLIWFIALAGVVWTLNSSSRAYLAGKVALLLTTLGTIGIVVAPFSGESQPLMNNYVPILRNPVFFVSLYLVGTGFTLLIIRSLIAPLSLGTTTGREALSIGAYASTVTAALTMISLAWSWQQLGSSLQGHAYYEMLFWGGGHVFQFTHTVLLLLTWLWLAQTNGAVIGFSPRLISILFILAAIPALAAPGVYMKFDILEAQHVLGFTEIMRWGGLTSIPLGIIALWCLFRTSINRPECRPVRYALWTSILLFGIGGILAFMIEGVNVVIPAHYHGSIVGVTLAFMGLTYYLLPKLGFRPPMPRTASWQPWVYGGGQLMHILGLAWSGGYGVQRKTAGTAQGLDSLPEVAGMAMMGLGGLIAIIGGILFIVVAIKSMWPDTNSAH